MASLHIDRARRVAAKNGGFAGDPRASELWELSKRELLEVALRLGALTEMDADDAGAGVEAVKKEHAILRAQRII